MLADECPKARCTVTTFAARRYRPFANAKYRQRARTADQLGQRLHTELVKASVGWLIPRIRVERGERRYGQP